MCPPLIEAWCVGRHCVLLYHAPQFKIKIENVNRFHMAKPVVHPRLI